MDKLQKDKKKGTMPSVELLHSSYAAANITLQRRQGELGQLLSMYCPHLLHTSDDDEGNSPETARSGHQNNNRNENFSGQAAKMCKTAANTFYQDKLASKGDSFDLQLDSSIDLDDDNRVDVSEQMIKLNKKFASKLDHSNYQETRQLFIMQLLAVGSTASMIKYVNDDLRFFVIPIIDLRINNTGDLGEREIHYPMTKTYAEWEYYFMKKTNGNVPESLKKMNKQKNKNVVNNENITLIHTQWPVYIKATKENGLMRGQVRYHHIIWSNSEKAILEFNKKPTPSKFITFAAMNATPLNPYGCSLGFETMNDLMIYDELERLFLEGIEFASDPSFVVSESTGLRQDTVGRILPGRTYYTTGEANAAVSKIDTQTNPQGLAAEIARRADIMNSQFLADNEIFTKQEVTATAIQEMMAEQAKQRRMDSKAVGKALEAEADAVLSILYDNQVIHDIHLGDEGDLLPQISTHTLKMVFRGLMTELEYVELARKFRAVLDQIPAELANMVIDYGSVVDDYIEAGGSAKYFVKDYRQVLSDLNEAFKNEVNPPQEFEQLGLGSANTPSGF